MSQSVTLSLKAMYLEYCETLKGVQTGYRSIGGNNSLYCIVINYVPQYVKILSNSDTTLRGKSLICI